MKRYIVVGDCDAPILPLEDPDGEWVLYEDAAAEIDRLHREIDGLIHILRVAFTERAEEEL